MARSRTYKSNLQRIFNDSRSPIYIVSENGTLEFANQACLNWTELTETQSRGAVCRYAVGPLDDEVENRLRGLTPPPQWFEQAAGQTKPENAGFLAFVQNKAGVSWRRASTQFIWLESNSVPSLLIVADETESKDPPATDLDHSGFESAALHQALVDARASMSDDYSLECLIGITSSSIQLRKKFELATGSSCELVIIGPPGSGREHLARVIHGQRHLDRATGNEVATQDGRLVPLHCAIADQQLVQENIQELFSDNFGSLRSSNKTDSPDCLLLLDVDQLSEAGQSELFGFLQLPGFTLNTICTSSQSLTAMAKTNRYHVELAMLLSTIEINIPALVERSADLPLLAKALLDRDNRHRNRNKAGFTAQAMQLLTEYQWPGNIDQLERTILAASDVATSTMINAKDLPQEFHQAISAQRIGRPVEIQIQLDDYLQTMERELIDRAMAQSDGVKSKAAKLLGISRARLIRRLAQLGLAADDSNKTDDDTADSPMFEEADE